jgi:hypothetical protein
MICSGRDDRIEKIENIPTQAKIGLEWATACHLSELLSNLRNLLLRLAGRAARG